MISLLPLPVSLSKAVADVCRWHPYDANGELDLNSPLGIEEVRKLWHRLLSLRGDRQRIAVRKLREAEIKIIAGTAEPRLLDQGVVDLLGLVVTEHQVGALNSLSWTAFLATDGRSEFRRGAMLYTLANRSRCPIWEAVARASVPSERCAREFLSQALDDLGSWLNRSDIALHAPGFNDAVRRRLISPEFIVELDDRIDGSIILQWVQLLVPGDRRIGWFASFLASTHAAHDPRDGHPWRMKHPIMTEIVREYGAPRAGGEIWQRVSPDVCKSVERWLTDQQLTQLLGENERTDFWRRFLDEIVDIQPNTDRRVVFIGFPGWHAVQFCNPGTATYMYRSSRVRGLRRWDEQEIARYVREHSWDVLGWYEHRGYTSTWQSKATYEVVRVLRQMTSE